MHFMDSMRPSYPEDMAMRNKPPDFREGQLGTLTGIVVCVPVLIGC